MAGLDLRNRDWIQSIAPAWPLKLIPIGSDIRRMQARGSAIRISRSAAAIVAPYSVTGSVEPDRVLVAVDTLEVRREPFSTESLVARLKAAVPDVPIVETTSLSDYDSFYYSRARQTPLPVLRVKFGDPAKTWFYIDPATSQIVSQVHRLNRVERWLYNGLHSLDFSFWYNKRPLWDIGMIVLSLGGLSSSGIGLYIGFKRVLRYVRRTYRCG